VLPQLRDAFFEPEGNKYPWAVKIKTSADPQYDVDGTYTARAEKRLNQLYKDPMFLRRLPMKVVSRNDSGQLPLSKRSVEVYLEGNDMLDTMILRMNKAAARSRKASRVSAQQSAQDTENQKHAGASEATAIALYRIRRVKEMTQRLRDINGRR
jgi:hypothetical protein